MTRGPLKMLLAMMASSSLLSSTYLPPRAASLQGGGPFGGRARGRRPSVALFPLPDDGRERRWGMARVAPRADASEGRPCAVSGSFLSPLCSIYLHLWGREPLWRASAVCPGDGGAAGRGPCDVGLRGEVVADNAISCLSCR